MSTRRDLMAHMTIHAICFIIFVQADIQFTSNDEYANTPTSDEKVGDIV